MSISGVLGFIALGGFLLVIAGAALAVNNVAQRRSGRPGVVLALLGLVIGFLFSLASSGLVIVGPTEVGVVFQVLGGDSKTNSLWSTPLQPGTHIITPVVNQVFIYSTELRTYTMSGTAAEGQKQGNDSISIRTSDGQEINLDVSVSYRIARDKVNLVQGNFGGPDYTKMDETFIRPTSRSIVRDAFSGYQIGQILGEKRGEIEKKITDNLRERFALNGFSLENFLLRDLNIGEDYRKAVDQRKIAEQQAEQAKLEAERNRTLAKGLADAAVTAAQGRADANVAEAKGEAQAIELRAAADAKGLALINEQIQKNPALIQWRYIDKLAQNISMILLPSNSPFLFDPNTLMQGTTKTTPPAASQTQGTKP